jgi:hypothetical protein
MRDHGNDTAQVPHVGRTQSAPSLWHAAARAPNSVNGCFRLARSLISLGGAPIREPHHESFWISFKPRLRALLDHFAVIEDPREPCRVSHPLAEAWCVAPSSSATKASRNAARPIWSSRVRSRRSLAHHHDEAHRSGAVLGCLHLLGARDLARPPQTGRHRWQDLTSKPQLCRRHGAAPPCLGVRHHQPSRSRPRGGRQQDQ